MYLFDIQFNMIKFEKRNAPIKNIPLYKNNMFFDMSKSNLTCPVSKRNGVKNGLPTH